MDPHDVLNLPRNHTLEQLRYNYKVLARQLHPDKRGNRLTQDQATQMFQVLTDAYKALLREHQAREADRQFDTLRAGAVESANEQVSRNAQNVDLNAVQKRFSVQRFNEVFDANRLRDDVRDRGYADWMARHDPTSASKPDRKNRQLIRYVEPEPVTLSRKGCVPYSELGESRVSDYSRSDAAQHAIQYTDYRVAHTTTKLVDESLQARTDFRSLDDLQHHRASLSHTMTPDEAEAYANAQLARERAEQRRQEQLRAQDDRVYAHFNNVHRAMLGFTTTTI
jgi:curved DNA-binding protein CbpA